MKRFLFVLVALAAMLAVASLQASAARPLGFTLSPNTLTINSTANTQPPGYGDVTVTTTHGPVVIATATTGPGFSDTQSGTCWQQYEALGLKIPGHTSCTIEVSFYSTTPTTVVGLLTVSRCTKWHTDSTDGFIVCDAPDGYQTVGLTGIAS